MTSVNHKDLAVAVKAVRAAQAKLALYGSHGRSVETIVGREWKVRADAELEKVILQVLHQETNYPILSEESGLLPGIGKRQWIVDPLDGSANYSRELPFCGISVGLWESNRPLLGVVLEIAGNRLYSGIVGVGAWCDEIPIELSRAACPAPVQAILCTGLPAELDHSPEKIGALIDAFRSFGKTRMLGSAALMLCYVASGKCDSYWECQIALWDVAAALAIVQSAGGEIRIGSISDRCRLDVEAASSKNLLVSELNGR